MSNDDVGVCHVFVITHTSTMDKNKGIYGDSPTRHTTCRSCSGQTKCRISCFMHGCQNVHTSRRPANRCNVSAEARLISSRSTHIPSRMALTRTPSTNEKAKDPSTATLPRRGFNCFKGIQIRVVVYIPDQPFCSRATDIALYRTKSHSFMKSRKRHYNKLKTSVGCRLQH